MENTGPLKGIRVLTFTHALAGPYGSSLLGDLGAEVIKVERPVTGDPTRLDGPPFKNGEGAYFFCANRNQKSLCLDIKKPEGVAVIKRLIKDTDVLMVNFRPGVMKRLGLGYEELTQIKPDLIYAELTAFGRNSPYRHKPGFEAIIQGLIGMVDITTPPGEEPSKIQIQLIDLCTGLFWSFATLAALYHRQATGEGQRVEASLLESGMAMLAHFAQIFFMTGTVPVGQRSRNPTHIPSQAFKSKDSYFLMVGHWDRLCRALGKPEWITDEKLGDNTYRVEHYEEVVEMIEAITTTKTTKEWLAILEEHEAASGPINSVPEAFQDPAVLATGMIKTIEHPRAGMVEMLDKPWHLSKTPGGLRRPSPLVGQHTEEILLENGFSKEELADLMDKKIVSGPPPGEYNPYVVF